MRWGACAERLGGLVGMIYQTFISSWSQPYTSFSDWCPECWQSHKIPCIKKPLRQACLGSEITRKCWNVQPAGTFKQHAWLCMVMMTESHLSWCDGNVDAKRTCPWWYHNIMGCLLDSIVGLFRWCCYPKSWIRTRNQSRKLVCIPRCIKMWSRPEQLLQFPVHFR